MGRKYNFIYSNLVENNNDIVGHIAYSLYKMDKIAFIERFKDQNNGREPEEKDIEAFQNEAAHKTRHRYSLWEDRVA